MVDNLGAEFYDPQALPAPDSTDAMEGTSPVCRICYRGATPDSGPLLSPCACKGSIGLTHKRCLERWLQGRDTDHCNVCLRAYAVRWKHPPLYEFFLEPDHRVDVLRIVVDIISCTGDVMVLGFAWTYASGFLGGSSWFVYVLVLGVLIFQTIFWLLVEIIRAMTCFEPVRSWRRKAAFIELKLSDGDPAHPRDGQTVAEERKASSSSFNTPMVLSPVQPVTNRNQSMSQELRSPRSNQPRAASSPNIGASADKLTKPATDKGNKSAL